MIMTTDISTSFEMKKQAVGPFLDISGRTIMFS
jgi:hypothetical protein